MSRTPDLLQLNIKEYNILSMLLGITNFYVQVIAVENLRSFYIYNHSPQRISDTDYVNVFVAFADIDPVDALLEQVIDEFLEYGRDYQYHQRV